MVYGKWSGNGVHGVLFHLVTDMGIFYHLAVFTDFCFPIGGRCEVCLALAFGLLGPLGLGGSNEEGERDGTILCVLMIQCADRLVGHACAWIYHFRVATIAVPYTERCRFALWELVHVVRSIVDYFYSQNTSNPFCQWVCIKGPASHHHIFLSPFW